jgi:hypothetical protein
VFFEGPDGAFRGIVSMAVRLHQLVSDIIVGEEVLQSGGCLVVESLEFWLETLDSELLMNGVICLFCYPFRGGPRFHGYDFNVVAIINIADHHIRVSFYGPHRELSRQVGVKLTLIDYNGVHEVGLCAQVSVRCWLFLNGRFRGGSYVLASLIHMAHGRSRCQFQMLVDGVLRQARPSDQMSVFDRL